MKNINDLIPDFSSLEIGEVDYSMLGDLSKITLVSFTADPVSIAPFGRAMISWEVADNDSRCRLQLNGVTVPRIGAMEVVGPYIESQYVLMANNNLHTKELGRVAVQMDLGTCRIENYPYVNQTFKTYLGIFLEPSTGLRYRGHPQNAISILTSPGNIHFELRMEYPVNNALDPHVDVVGDLGLHVVQDGPLVMRKKIHGYFRNLNIEVSGTLFPLPEPVRSIKMGFAEDAARNMLPALFDRVINTGAISGFAPQQMGIHSVTLDAGSDGHGLLRRTFCPVVGPIGPRPPRSTASKARK